jgi:hypothetical protein
MCSKECAASFFINSFAQMGPSSIGVDSELGRRQARDGEVWLAKILSDLGDKNANKFSPAP